MQHPYTSHAYANAFGSDHIWLRHVDTHVLKRPIGSTGDYDAMGCYPLFVFKADEGIESDWEQLRNQGLVSLVVVTDCLTQPSLDFLQAHFDVCRQFKTHYAYDARLPSADYTKHHRDRVRRALKSCEVRVVQLSEHLDDWIRCYDTLVAKKGITGIQAFSRSYFERIAEMTEGVTTVAAFAAGEFVAAHIWFFDETNVYAHLAASTPEGYKLRAAFAIYDHAIQLFRGRTIDFGGGAGVAADGTDGLSEFKKGFANFQRQNYLCGKILHPELYSAHCRQSNIDPEATAFFPAYRRIP